MCIYKALDIRIFILSIISKNITQNYIYKKHASSEITIDYASFLVATGADTRQWKPILHVPDIEDFGERNEALSTCSGFSTMKNMKGFL